METMVALRKMEPFCSPSSAGSNPGVSCKSMLPWLGCLGSQLRALSLPTPSGLISGPILWVLFPDYFSPLQTHAALHSKAHTDCYNELKDTVSSLKTASPYPICPCCKSQNIDQSLLLVSDCSLSNLESFDETI